MKTYKELCNENKYLYGKLEKCTLMMGLALLNKQDKIYNQYQDAKSEISYQIEINLDLIEEIWNSEVMERPAKRIHVNRLQKFEWDIIMAYKADPDLSFLKLSKKLGIGKYIVEVTINTYLANKYQEKEVAA